MLNRSVPILAGLLLASLAGTAGVWLHGRTALAEARQSHLAYVAQVERNAREASEAARIEEQRRKEAQLEIVQLARRSAQRTAEDLARRVAVSERLRERAGQLAIRCAGPSDLPVADGSQTAGSAGAVLVDMLGRIEQAAGELAAFADAASNSGTACERAYDSLTDGRRQDIP
ncbi:DUF2514 family protein [Ideonella sp.]|uniref:DUF2514 family protein n=1 Tax=Ideonella sp. TaxID=1929293 RepID=UPI0035AF1E6B